jgi:Family of unknown function (DUF6491)
MRPITSSIIAATALFAAAQAASADPKPWPEYGVEAHIPFANSVGIRNFEPNGDRGIWIEDQHQRWYYASIIGPCVDLDHATVVGFDARGTGSLDKFGAVVVDGDVCRFDSLVTAEKPLPRKERLKIRKEVREEAKKAVAPAD